MDVCHNICVCAVLNVYSLEQGRERIRLWQVALAVRNSAAPSPEPSCQLAQIITLLLFGITVYKVRSLAPCAYRPDGASFVCGRLRGLCGPTVHFRSALPPLIEALLLWNAFDTDSRSWCMLNVTW